MNTTKSTIFAFSILGGLLGIGEGKAANNQVGDDTSMIVPIADKILKAQLFQATRIMNND